MKIKEALNKTYLVKARQTGKNPKYVGGIIYTSKSLIGKKVKIYMVDDTLKKKLKFN